MNFHIRKNLILLSLFSVAISCLISRASFAQNADRLKEEEVKEQERIFKYKQYLRERETEEKALLEKPITVEEMETKNLVEVEPNNILPSDLVSNFALVPYRIRRQRWGHMFSVLAGYYHPLNYKSDFDLTQESFDNAYGKSASPYVEFNYNYKWNFVLGSVGGEISYGTYSNKAIDENLDNSTLNLQIGRIGVRYIADNLFYEPKFAPYGYVGIYSVKYLESQSGQATFNGTTGIAFYYGGGIMLQLSWLDPSAAVDAFTESGIENTYLFAELRQYMASKETKDPDFSTDLDVNFGLTIEF